MRRLITIAAAFMLAGLPTSGVAQPQCSEPGLTVLTDEAGDATSQAPEHDVLSLSISQPTELGGFLYVFTLQMASMANPTANTTWPVIFSTPNFQDRFVRMYMDPALNVSFQYGFGTNPSGSETPGTDAHPASSFDADGTIRIVVPGDAVGNPQPGQFLSAFLTRIRVEGGPVGALTPDNMPSDLSRQGSYEAENCGTVPVTDVSVGAVKGIYRVK